MSEVDNYIESVIARGDKDSALLAALLAPTLKNSEYVEIVSQGMHGISVLRIPQGRKVIVHSASGNPEENDPACHAASLVDRLVAQAEAVKAIPLGFANVIDASEGGTALVAQIAGALKVQAKKYRIPVLNGELAILGGRVGCEANMSGTMISMMDEPSSFWHNAGPITNHDKVYFKSTVFDPEGQAIYINSDGIGTKLEFRERMGLRAIPIAGADFAAMNLDDTIKLGARAMALSGIGEMSSNHHESRQAIEEMERLLGNQLYRSGLTVTITPEHLGDRVRSYKEGVFAFNVSGSTVSVIDEKFLKNPLAPSEGEYLVAIAGKPNPRSNGITGKRELMEEMLGKEWHDTPMGIAFLDHLAEPSTVLYPVFRKLVDEGLASSVYHMSGGAYKGKLAKPLAAHGMYCEVEGLFNPDWRDLAIRDLSHTNNEDAYQKWPMGTDGFLTTTDTEKAISMIQSLGLGARVVGKLQAATEEKSGVTLKGIPDSEGNDVYYSGKAA